MKPTFIYADRDYRSAGIEIRLVQHDAQGNPCAALPAVFSSVEDGAFIPPTIVLKNSEAQELMDKLWQCGVRPADGTGSTGAMAATQSHLNDMRTLAFHALKVPETVSIKK